MNDEYSIEINRSKIYHALKTKCSLESDTVNSSVINLVNSVIQEACIKAKTIIKYLPEYTLHDETHLFRVLSIMERLIPEKTIQKLSIPELMMLILVSFLHDIGMAPEENKIRAWKKDWINSEPTEHEKIEYEKFNRFRSTFIFKIEEIDKLINQEEYQKAQLLEDYIISEYIRNTHEQRARKIIAEEWADKIIYKDKKLAYELSLLCFSHGNDALSLLEVETNVLCDEDIYLCTPFIGVVLRLADILDFDAKRTPSVLFSHLSVRNPVSLKEWQKHRSIQSWIIRSDKIAYHAQCSHPAIEKSINVFCDNIDKELVSCSNVLARINDDFRKDMDHYKIGLPAKVDRTKIQPEINIKTNEPKYIYKDTSFELSKAQIIDLLMGTKLYDDTKSALRELIQNSIDACLVANALCKKLNIHYFPEIIIKYYSESGVDILEVVDNGIGMNQKIIEEYYSKVGSSFYKSKDFYDLKAQTGLSFKPISRFGIGILSCFMVSDTIEVSTRKLLENGDKDKTYNISIEGYDSIFAITAGERINFGTATRLTLRKKENPWENIRSEKFYEYVKDLIPNPPVPLKIEIDKNTESVKSIDQETFKLVSPDILRNHQWEKTDYIKEIRLSINNEVIGLEGCAIIGILEENGEPVSFIEDLKRNVTIDDEIYTLESKIRLKENEVEKISTIIEVDVDSGIDTNENTSTILKSQSKLSIHGIDLPEGLFPDYFSRNKKSKLRWHLPMLIVLDVTGMNDIDLNSARTEIVYNEKWRTFERNLAEIILIELKGAVSEDYWEILKRILLDSKSSEEFIEALKCL